jgi:hypothetical protein
MDDGGKLDYNKNSKNKSVVLNTQGFSELEVINLATELASKFHFKCEVRSNKGRKIIVINSVSYPLFRKLVDPYVLPREAHGL